jgi:hypothetical protein
MSQEPSSTSFLVETSRGSHTRVGAARHQCGCTRIRLPGVPSDDLGMP